MLNLNTRLRGILAAPRTLLCLLVFSTIYSVNAQNSYPTYGDALINGVRVGAGPGFWDTSNTALGRLALSANVGGSTSVGIGCYALSSNTSGSQNTAVGFYALSSNIGSTYGGQSNTAIGYYSLLFNTQGALNTALGSNAMVYNTTGSFNTACGLAALEYNTSGNGNVAFGDGAMQSGTGNNNVAIGYQTMAAANGASYVVAVGDSALNNNTAGYNTAIGSKVLAFNTSGYGNTALGFHGLYANTTGSNNTAGGYNALVSNQGGNGNAAYGLNALYTNSSGGYNTATGSFSLYNNANGNYNTGSGLYAMYYNTSGSFNTALGLEALLANTTGTENTALGAYAGTGPGNLTNTTAIGYGASVGTSNSVVIGNSSVTSIGGYAGWTNFSDGRFKKNITHNVPGLAFINKLAPITYTLDIDGIETMRHNAAAGAKSPNGTGTTSAGPLDDPAIKQAMKEKSAVVYTGFVAQDVDQAARSVGYNFSGVDKPKDDQKSFYGLRYSDFVVPLVKAVQELSTQNDSLQQANAQLSGRVDQLEQRMNQLEQLLGIKGATSAAGTAGATNAATLSLSSARLFQNNPNPFGAGTVINYYLPVNTGSALIQISGMNGETIKSIALSGTGAGQVSVQTAQLAAGTYVYSLIVDGNLVDTKKMVLAR